MRVIFILLFFFTGTPIFSQHVFFGFPANVQEVVAGDRIIMNLPEHNNANFLKLEDFDALFEIMKENEQLEFRIEIHLFHASDNADLIYTEGLKKSLESIIRYKYNSLSKTPISNFSIEAKGRNTPLFGSKGDPHYKRLNTRIEIFVEI